ncbi:MAG: SMC-Scp complex subunit ScpB [Terracidiphilus sp.]
MSLRAKLEAVIYAAEEPVTLTQLAALFADDAFEWRAEQEAVARDAEAMNQPAQLPQIDEGLSYLGLDQSPEFDNAAENAASQEESESSARTASDETQPAEAIAATGSEGIPESAEPLDPETEAKRLARQRDREIKAILRQILDELIAAYAADDRGIEVREIAGGYRMATKPECHDAVRSFIRGQKPPMKLSLPALETLAVIAYKQPVTAPEVNEIRGVDSSGVFGSLLSRKLITTAGRKQVIGRPILYKTTKEFLLRFGLKDVSELPSMEEFEKMAAIELTETEEAEDVGGPGPEGGPELDESAPEDDEAVSVELVKSADSANPRPDVVCADEAPEEPSASKEREEAQTAPHD